MDETVGLFDRIPVRREWPPPGCGMVSTFKHCKRHRFQRGEVGKEGVDLEGAREAALDACIGPERSDVVRAEQDLAAVRAQHPGDEVDERGLAGAVGPDQRVAHPLRQRELDVLRHDQRAELLVQFFRCKNFATPPSTPLGRNITTATSSRPIQKYQYCGFMPENWSRATM